MENITLRAILALRITDSTKTFIERRGMHGSFE